jgi:hypothetical protein
MNFKFLYHRIKNIILNPVKAWSAIHSEEKPLKYVRGSFFIPLIMLVAVSAFLGSVLFTHTGFLKIYSVLVGIKYFFLFYITIYVTAFIFSEVGKGFALKMNFTVSFKIIAYSLAPFLICQIISRLIESFIFINVLAFYGLFIYWIGVEKMVNPPVNKKLPLMIITAGAFLVLLLTTNRLLTMIIDKLYFAYFA